MAKKKYLQVRADDEDKARAHRLAELYGVSISDLFRFAMSYIETKRPPMKNTTTIKAKQVIENVQS